jgi:transglutaminase superfamily protein
MWEKLRRFSALERPAQKMFLRALVALPLVSLSLKLFGFQATRNALQLSFSTAAPVQDLDSPNPLITLTAHMVNSADRHGFGQSTCLAKSLTLWWLLGIQGITSQLRIGVRKENQKLEAHAWVERDGLALNEPEERHHHYAAFDAAFPSPSQDK